MAFFDEVKEALEEAVEIAQGNKEPERVTTVRVEVVDGKEVFTRVNDSAEK